MFSNAKLIIVGLDGATFDILRPLFAQQALPTLERLYRDGWRADLLSTLPVATLPAWTSFLTAAQPAQHGVTDIFMRRGYGLQPATGRARRLPTFLKRLSDEGLAVASLGVPGTFPPEELTNGLCIAGFDAPGAKRAGAQAVWPSAFWPELQRLGGWTYATFNEHRGGAKHLEKALSALHADIAAKEATILSIYQRQHWDVFFVHLQASDTVAHHLWHTYDRHSPRHQHAALHDAIPSVYRRLDTLIGRLLACADDDTRVLVVSDHGMGGASTTAVHLNRWLEQQGLLRFARPSQRTLRRRVSRTLHAVLAGIPPAITGPLLRLAPAPVWTFLLQALRGTAVDFARSEAFSDELDYAPAIWLNRVDRFAQGCVSATYAEALSQRIAAALLTLRDPVSDAPLVHAVHPRHTLPPGPSADALPDLLIEPAWPGNYRASFLASDGPGPTVRHMSPAEFGAPKGAGMPGVHRREGVFIASGPGLDAADLPPMHIAQAGALVYDLLGRAVPADLAQQLEPATVPHGPPVMPDTTAAYSPAQTLQLTQRLQAMGYID